MGEFTHFNGQGEAIMVDVSEKQDTAREGDSVGAYPYVRRMLCKGESR